MMNMIETSTGTREADLIADAVAVMKPELAPWQYRGLIESALAEDLGRAGDVTSAAVIPAGTVAEARLRSRRDGRVAGLPIAVEAFRQLDPKATFELAVAEGDPIAAGDTLLIVRGDARAILAAERTALNVLGRLCGIATVTAEVVASLAGTDARVVCTRKTTPLLRALEKHAVRCGGGFSHRFGLDDAILIKDNHIAIAGSAAEAVRRARAVSGHLVKVEVELDDLDELESVLECGADVVMLDNMQPDALRRAVAINRRRRGRRAILEASGGITPETARAIAETGVDVLSLGWLTHSAPALDVGLDFNARSFS